MTGSKDLYHSQPSLSNLPSSLFLRLVINGDDRLLAEVESDPVGRQCNSNFGGRHDDIRFRLASPIHHSISQLSCISVPAISSIVRLSLLSFLHSSKILELSAHTLVTATQFMKDSNNQIAS